MDITYTHKSGVLINSEGVATADSFLLLRDKKNWREENKAELQEYFHNAFMLFQQHLLQLKHISKELNDEEEYRLRFMLESLIQAKKLWREEGYTEDTAGN